MTEKKIDLGYTISFWVAINKRCSMFSNVSLWYSSSHLVTSSGLIGIPWLSERVRAPRGSRDPHCGCTSRGIKYPLNFILEMDSSARGLMLAHTIY